MPEEKAARQPSKNPKSSKKEIENGIRNIQHEINSKEGEVKKEYQFPPMTSLKRRAVANPRGIRMPICEKQPRKLQETLRNFGVNVTITNVSCRSYCYQIRVITGSGCEGEQDRRTCR